MSLLSWIEKFSPNRIDPVEREQARLRIVKFIFVIYFLLIFEGALRKWFLSPIEKPLLLIRDPFTIYVYYLAFRYGWWPSESPLLKVGIIFALGFGLLGIVQVLTIKASPIYAAYGWRNYFFNLPLAAIMGDCLRGKDLIRMIRQTLLITIPMAALVFLQYRSSPAAWINKELTDGKVYVYGGGENILVRTTGTFTFCYGMELYCGSVICLMMVAWLLPKKQRPLPPRLLILASAAALSCLLLNGDRGVFAFFLVSLMASVVTGFIITDKRFYFRAVLLPCIVLVAGGLVYFTFFHEAFDAMANRVEGASSGGEEVKSRFLDTYLGAYNAMRRAKPIGSGLGAGVAIRATGTASNSVKTEIESAKVVDECGPLGLLYLGFRLGVVIWLTVEVVAATRRTNNPLPMQLAAFVWMFFPAGLITGNISTNGYGWLFLGFLIASTKLGTLPVLAPAGRVQSPDRITGS